MQAYLLNCKLKQVKVLLSLKKQRFQMVPPHIVVEVLAKADGSPPRREVVSLHEGPRPPG